jgi:hypothetical protein
MSTHPVLASMSDRAAAACAPMGHLEYVVESQRRDTVKTWFVVRPHEELKRRYQQLGLTLEPGCRVVVDGRSLQPVGVLPAGKQAPSAGAFNPYFDLPPA